MEKEDKLNLIYEIQDRLELLKDNKEGVAEDLMIKGLIQSTGALGLFYERFYQGSNTTVTKED